MKEKVSLIFPWPHSILSKLCWNNFIFTHFTQREFKKLGAAYGLWGSQEVCGIVPNKYILPNEGTASWKAYQQKYIPINDNPKCTNPNQRIEQYLLLGLCTSHWNPQRLVSYDQIATPVAATRATRAYLTTEIQPD